ncbi:MAG: MaoC family dehydratase [Eubacterium sp.]|nr:MaoC family dehydratase [Eubacterium sp.]
MNDYSMLDLEIGKEEKFNVCITKEMLDTFAHLTGDVNPLHLNDTYARKSGFTGRIAYGMLTASFYSTLAGVYLPGERCLLHRCDVEWRKPVYIGDTLTVSGVVNEVDDRFGRVIIKAIIVNQMGKKVSKATLVAGVR